MIYRFLDIFFVVFHTSVIIFNLAGWVWERTRKYNLALLLLTAGSWLILGWIVGTPGYCPLTDWHFRVLEKLGKTDLPESYIKYLADRLTGMDFSPRLTDHFTLWLFVAALLVSASLNLRDFTRNRHRN
jgi:hypothetical protein